MTADPPTETAPRGLSATGPQSALPPLWARVVAFGSVLLGGAAGGFIGAAFGRLGNFGPLATGALLLVCGLGFAGGVAVVAVLTLRALGEWNTIRVRR
ncbi:MAG: hypothetical protein ACK5O2_01825 [Microthrixaceae bacterium]